MRRLLILPLLLIALPARAEELSATEIAQRASDSGAADAVRESITMTLGDASGSASSRTLSISRRRNAKTKAWDVRLEFRTPKDVAGTVLLSLGKAAGTSDQYLWLPGIRRTRRVGGSQKSGSFQGTDFSYEDLEVRDVAAAVYTKLADEKLGEDDCWSLEAKPAKGTDSGYAKTIALVRKSDFVTLRVRFFDSKSAEIKTLEVDAAKIKVDGAIRVPQKMEMKTAAGHRTTLEVTSLDLHPKIDDAVFDPASLDKG